MQATPKDKKLAPTHFIRLLNACLQTNLCSGQMIEQYTATDGLIVLKPAQVEAMIVRLEKACAHEDYDGMQEHSERIV